MILISIGGVSGPKLEMDSFLGLTMCDFKTNISQQLCVRPDSFYLTYNGRILRDLSIPINDASKSVVLIPRVLGGKGGFGSMLRAIGAQIEKTTNRDACRDLSGRRLRDINEEQRLKRWFAKQKERDELKQENKKKKLEKLRKFCEGPPLPIMEDREYNQQRADMSESVFEAVDKGFEAAASSSKSQAASSSSSSSVAASTSAAKPSDGTSSSSSSSSSDEKDETPPHANLEKTETKVELPEKSEIGKRTAEKPPSKLKKTTWDDDLDSDVSSSDSEDDVPAKKAKIA